MSWLSPRDGLQGRDNATRVFQDNSCDGSVSANGVVPDVAAFRTHYGRYVSGTDDIHIHFGVGKATVGIPVPYFCAVVGMTEWDGTSFGDTPTVYPDYQHRVRESSIQNGESSVLVGILELTEDVKGPPLSGVGGVRLVGPFLKRLRLLDDCRRAWIHALGGVEERITLYAALSYGATLREDGEVDISLVLGLRHGDGDVIERRTNVEQVITQDSAQQETGLSGYLQDPFAVITVQWGNTFGPVMVSVNVLSSEAVEVSKVMLCPTDLYLPGRNGSSHG